MREIESKMIKILLDQNDKRQKVDYFMEEI